MCMFPDKITSKKVLVEGPVGYAEVPGDTQCRTCSRGGDEALMQQAMLSRQCIASSDDCRYYLMWLVSITVSQPKPITGGLMLNSIQYLNSRTFTSVVIHMF